MIYRDFLKIILYCCSSLIIQARELHDKRDPFHWAAAHTIKLEHKQKKNEAAQEVKQKKIQAQLSWNLAGISFNVQEPCALLTNGKGTLIVRKDQDIGQGWKIDKINQTCIECKHTCGDLRELKL